MAWRLRFGDASMSLEIPEAYPLRALSTASITPLLDPTQAVRDALDAPTGSPRLRDLAGGARHVLLVVPDRSEGAALPVLLPQVLDVLQDSGVGLRQVEILVATGSRPHLEADALEAFIGPEIWNRVAVRQHDPSDLAGCTDLGESERGTPLFLNHKAVESGQLVILVGGIAPHPLAGFGGGPRLVLPGLAAMDSILAHERLALNEVPDVGVRDACRAGELESNPLYQDSLEAADKVDPDFLLHSLQDEEGRMVRVVAGDWRKAHEGGCEWLRAKLRIAVGDTRPWAVASAGGFPHDRSLFQAFGALREAAVGVRDGGHLLFLAECREGLGSPDLERWLEREEDNRGLERRVREEHGSPDGPLAVGIRQLAERIQVHLVSALPAETVRRLGMVAHASADEGWAALSGAVEPAAGYVVPSAAHCLLETAARREPVVEERPVA